MLNQRVLASLLAVTTVTIAVTINVTPSYGNNSIKVLYLAQGKRVNWRERLSQAKNFLDLATKIYANKDLPQNLINEAKKLIDSIRNKVAKGTATQSDADKLSELLRKINVEKFANESRDAWQAEQAKQKALRLLLR